jgi:hypothetical protein
MFGRYIILSNYYIGSAEGHEYPDLQVGDEVNPSPSFYIFLDLINKDSLGTENRVPIIQIKRIWSTKARRFLDPIKPGVRACGPKHTTSL